MNVLKFIFVFTFFSLYILNLSGCVDTKTPVGGIPPARDPIDTNQGAIYKKQPLQP